MMSINCIVAISARVQDIRESQRRTLETPAVQLNLLLFFQIRPSILINFEFLKGEK